MLFRSVKVNGSRSDLGKIDELVATADVNGITNDTFTFLRVKAYDEKGKELENVRCEPASVLAHIQVGTIKKVKVKAPKISGTPEDGYQVTDVSVTPGIEATPVHDMSAGKLAAQATHAAQLAWESPQMLTALRRAWAARSATSSLSVKCMTF